MSGNAIISAGIPLGSSPLFRQLYDRTLETYPSAFILVSTWTVGHDSPAINTLYIYSSPKNISFLAGKSAVWFAFFQLSAGSAVLQCFLNFFLFTQRGRFKDKMRSDEDDVVSEAGSDCSEEKKGAELVVG